MTIWNLLFYVDLETSSKIKLTCVPTHYYWSIPFLCCELLFFNFFTCMQGICSWGTNHTFLPLLPFKVFITIWLPKWGQFWEVGGKLQIHIWVVHFDGLLHHWLQSHLCLTLDHVGGQLQLQLQSHLCPTWADCWVVQLQKSLKRTPVFPSAAYDWIRSSASYGQWVKKHQKAKWTIIYYIVFRVFMGNGWSDIDRHQINYCPWSADERIVNGKQLNLCL